MAGDGLIRPLNAPLAALPVPGVQPGTTQAVVIANRVIVYGANGGIFIYSGTPAFGNLIESETATSGTDPYGNAYLAGSTSYGADGPSFDALNITSGQINWWSAGTMAGPWAVGTGIDGRAGVLNIGAGAGANIQFLIQDQELFLGTGASVGGRMTVLFPSGDTSGVTDTANINAVIGVTGGAALLLPAQLSGPYVINTPLLPASQSRLWGSFWSRASVNDFYGIAGGASTGSVIQMTTGFTGDAAISMPDPGVGVQNFGVDLAGFTVEGFSVTPGGTIYGLHAVGAWGSCQLRGVTLHRTPSDCFRTEPSGVTSIAPDEWAVSQCAFSGSRAGYGAHLAYFDDAWITDCESSANELDQWYLDHGVNTRLTSCKAEDSQAGTTSNGFRFGGLNASQALWLTGCSTHLNLGSGFVFDNSGTGGTGLGTYILTGCIAQQDKTAGFISNGCKSRIIGTGCMAQTDASVTKPLFGAEELSSSYGVCFTGSLLQGATAATHDDGSNTHALVNQSPVPF